MMSGWRRRPCAGNDPLLDPAVQAKPGPRVLVAGDGSSEALQPAW